MKDEIKEILESLRKIIKLNRENGFDRIIMLGDDIDKLLDYITNLQEELEEQKRIEQADFKKIQNLEEENQRLKEEQNENPLRGIFAQVTDDDLLRSNGAMYSELEDYKSRIDEVVEILKNAKNNCWDIDINDLLKILGGDEK